MCESENFPKFLFSFQLFISFKVCQEVLLCCNNSLLHIHLSSPSLSWDIVILTCSDVEKQTKEVLPFFCWKEWGMMGSVVGIERQCWTLNSKLWAQFRKRRGLCSGSKSLFSAASDWDQSTFLPDEGKLRSTAEKTSRLTVFTRVLFLFLASSWMIQDAKMWLVPVPPPEWQLKLEGGNSLQCKRAPNLCVVVAEQLWWILCLSLLSRMGKLLEKRHSSRDEVSQVDWARFMLVKRSTGHLWLSELIGRLHSSVHWL